MAGGQPFMYDPVPKETSRQPYKGFDPKAVSRASLTPRAPKPKQEGPLLDFNKHPDSYLVLPYGNINAKPMSTSVKTKVKWTRIIQLLLRCVELLGALGLLTTMILITGVEPATAWLMRIPPGFAILHVMYAIYHLGRKPSGRTPASSASYMLFAAAFDVSLIPFFAFSSLMASSQYRLSLNGPGTDEEWDTLLPEGQALVPALSGTAFLCSVIAGGLHLISLALSLWLAVTFRKITKLPPDMNPLEDNLTSRHKRNKSSISASTISEKRLSEPLESKRNSGAPYESLSRPPTIPFMDTRSTESFATYRTTPPKSRDSRLDLPSRQWEFPNNSDAPRFSRTELKRSSMKEVKRSSVAYASPSSPPERVSYASIPLSEKSSESALSQRSSRQLGTSLSEAWHTAESLPTSQDSRSRSSSPMKGGIRYHPLYQNFDKDEQHVEIVSPPKTKLSANTLNNFSHPNPLEANPPTPRLPPNRTNRSSALSELSSSQRNVSGSTPSDLADIDLISNSSSAYSTDPTFPKPSSKNRHPAKPYSHTPAPQRVLDHYQQSKHRESGHSQHQQPENSSERQPENPFPFPAAPARNPTPASFKARYYGDLKSATPPILIGTNATGSGSGSGSTNADRTGRQVSSGNDYGLGRVQNGRANPFGGRREVSGKVVEEGRSLVGNHATATANTNASANGTGNGVWGTRFRKISGLGLSGT